MAKKTPRPPKSTWSTEWVSEPTDAHGDIIDPLFNETEAQARAVVSFDDPAVSYWDIAKLRRYGNNDQGELAREYDYVERIHRDGRIEQLATHDDISPVVLPNLETLSDAELTAALDSPYAKLRRWARYELDARAYRARTALPVAIGNGRNSSHQG